VRIKYTQKTPRKLTGVSIASLVCGMIYDPRELTRVSTAGPGLDGVSQLNIFKIH
jgi:hypothetical protein